MNHTDRLVEVALRKERLLANIAQQRRAIATEWQVWEKPAAIVDRAINLAKFIRSRPLLIAVVVAIIAALRLRGAKGWLGRGLVLWRVWSLIRTWVRRWSADGSA